MVNDPEIMARLGAAGLKNLPSLEQADRAYPWLLQFLPTGMKGLAFAALAAAIVSSLASMLNSTSTIFTMDIYKQYINKNASDKQTVNVGRLSAGVALVIACIMAPLLGGIDQAFQFIQEYTGIVSPGILAVFMLGLFWKKTTNKAAIIGALTSIPIAVAFKATTMPWMDQMGLTAVLTMVVIVIASLIQHKGKDDEKAIEITKELFKTSPLFNIGAFAIMLVLVALYSIFWK
jgi:SSS family solute:Na+ symporter